VRWLALFVGLIIIFFIMSFTFITNSIPEILKKVNPLNGKVTRTL
jgi:ABC-type dipeptide/oligopeptide/nickel transport system permease subunit